MDNVVIDKLVVLLLLALAKKFRQVCVDLLLEISVMLLHDSGHVSHRALPITLTIYLILVEIIWLDDEEECLQVLSVVFYTFVANLIS